jgi:hypothetical protein
MLPLTPRRFGLLLALLLPLCLTALAVLAAEEVKGHPVVRVIDGGTNVVKIDGKEEKTFPPCRIGTR